MPGNRKVSVEATPVMLDVTKLRESLKDVDNMVEIGSDNRRQVDSRGHGTNITKGEDPDQCGVITSAQVTSREKPIDVANAEAVPGTAKFPMQMLFEK